MSKAKRASKTPAPRPARGPGPARKGASKSREGLYPYEAPASLSVAEPAVAYEIAPIGASVEETLALLSPTDQADLLEVSSKTLTRWRKTGEALTPQQTDRVARIEAIFKHGEHVLGSREEVHRWINGKVFYLGGRRPLDLLKTESGREKVDEALGVIEWGMF